MKRSVSLLLVLILGFSVALSGITFAGANDPVQFIVNSAVYIEDQSQLQFTGQYVNVGSRSVTDVVETYVEVYSNGQLVVSGTVPKTLAEYISVRTGDRSREHTMVLPNPVTKLDLKNITSVSTVVFNSSNPETLPLGKKVYYNGTPITYDVPPAVVNGRLLVPARATFEKMSANVEWNSDSKAVTVKRKDDVIIIVIGKDFMTVNGKPTKLDSPAQIIDGRTLVPLRAISSALGDKVLYGAQSEIVTIYSVK